MPGHTQGDQEPEPTWEEANAAVEAAEPAELVRPARKLSVVYQYADGCRSATSPDLDGFAVVAASLSALKTKVAAALGNFLDPAVELDEHVAEPAATLAPRQTVHIAVGDRAVVTVDTSSRSRTFISSRSLRVPA
jgi:hypothetical protein